MSREQTVIDVQLLDALLLADGPLAIDDLARSCNVGAADVLQKLEALRAAGCALAVHPRDGVVLTLTGLAAWTDYLEAKTGFKVEVYRRTASTQDAMRRLIQSRRQEADGALIVADEQEAGRGRLGRRWFAPAGSAVLMSIRVVRQDLPAMELMSLAVAVGVCQAIDARVQIKWPNDLQIDDKKLGGILIERVAGDAVAIGIGINVGLTATQLDDAPAEVAANATSLAMEGLDVDRLRVIAAVYEQVMAWVNETDVETVLAAWRRRSALLGRQIKLQTDGQVIAGTVMDVHPTEGLIVRDGMGAVHYLPSGTTSVVG